MNNDQKARIKWQQELEQKQEAAKELIRFLRNNRDLPPAVEDAIGIKQDILSYDIGALRDRMTKTEVSRNAS